MTMVITCALHSSESKGHFELMGWHTGRKGLRGKVLLPNSYFLPSENRE